MKRLANRAIACALLLFALPLIAIIALLIKFESPGPAFVSQQRLGGDGGPFRLRFRIAASRSAHVTPPGGHGMTRIGRFLEYTRIADLPQLIDVARGEMTLIDSDSAQPRFLD